MMFLGVMGCETINKLLDSVGDMDHIVDRGILKGILPLQDMGNCTNFADNSRNCQRILLKVF